MTMIDELILEADKVKIEEFDDLLNKCSLLLENERKIGYVEGITIYEDLIYCPPSSIKRCIIIGDIHGDLDSLSEIFRRIDLDKISKENTAIVFLGDYGDRGDKSVEVYYLLLKLKLKLRHKIVLLRGNHEGPDDLLAQPHDLPLNFIEKFGQNGYFTYLKLRKFFDKLYLAFAVMGKFIALHGGIPSNAKTIEDIATARKIHPKKRLLEELLWNDPMEEKGLRPSYRGAGFLFGKDITANFLNKNNFFILIRGHEPARNGYFISQEGKVITVFSRKGSPYFNEKAAYLDINIEELNSERDIEKFVITF